MCHKCGQSFSSAKSLEYHLFKTKQDCKSIRFGKESVICSICHKVYSSQQYLSLHEKKCVKEYGLSLSTVNSSKIPCSRCNKQFSTRSNLTRHQKSACTGSRDKQIVCEFCNKVFSKQGNLNNHLRKRVCQSDSIKLKGCYACKNCNRKFRIELNRDKHMQKCKLSIQTSQTIPAAQIHHVSSAHISNSEIESSDVTCLLCREVFPSSELLISHLAVCSKRRDSKRYKIQMPKSQSSKSKTKNVYVGYGASDKDSSTPSTHGVHKVKRKRFNILDAEVDDSVQVDEDTVSDLGPARFTTPKKLVFKSKKKRQIMKDLKKRKKVFMLGSERFRCRICGKNFPNKKQQNDHFYTFHRGIAGMKPRPWVDGVRDPPWVEEGIENFLFKKEYLRYEPYILLNDDVDGDPVKMKYNFPTYDLEGGVNEIMEKLRAVASHQTKSFVLEIYCGYFIENKEREENPYTYIATGDHKGYFGSENRIVISEIADLQIVKDYLEQNDIREHYATVRPNTKSVLKFITNFAFSLSFTNFVMGKGILPSYIQRNPYIFGLDVNKAGDVYKDNLCAFRCLSYHIHKVPTASKCIFTKQMERHVSHYYSKWRAYLFHKRSEVIPRNPIFYEGVRYIDLPDFENCFQLQLKIYERQSDNTVKPFYLSSCDTYQDVLYLNLYGNHLSYVTNFQIYARKFKCMNCAMFFKSMFLLNRHKRVCVKRSRVKYPGGILKPNLTVFEELEHYQIFVPESERLYPWFCCFDFESMLLKDDIGNQSTAKEKRVSFHTPISVSICSNLEGYKDPHTIVNPDVNILAKRMIDYMSLIQQDTLTLAKKKWSHVFDSLQGLLNKWKPNTDSGDSDELLNSHFDMGTTPLESDSSDSFECIAPDSTNMYNDIKRLCRKFILYCSQLIVLSYNGSRYDIQLIKSTIVQILGLCTQKEDVLVIKRANAYVAIQNSKFRFLDCMSYLTAGCSYSRFLRTFGVEEKKQIFCYEYLDSYDKLYETSLPSYDNFYSTLKNENVLESDYNQWVREGKKGNAPKTGEENYRDLIQIWRDNEMVNLKDLLCFYNAADCYPFVLAVSKMFEMFNVHRTLDIFKDFFSAPGLARRILFNIAREKRAVFSLFDEDNSDLYTLFRKGCVGGPSISFCRMQSVGETCIRGNPEKVCQSIDAIDVNGLYTYCFSKPLPSGLYVRRYEASNFKPYLNSKHLDMYFWLEYESVTKNVKIDHYLTNGKEFRVSGYLADGHAPEINTVFEVRYFFIK